LCSVHWSTSCRRRSRRVDRSSRTGTSCGPVGPSVHCECDDGPGSKGREWWRCQTFVVGFGQIMLPSKTFYVLRSRSYGQWGRPILSFTVAGLDVQKCHGGSFSEPSRWHRERLAVIFGRLTQTQPAPAAVPRTLRPGLSFSSAAVLRHPDHMRCGPDG